MFNAPCVLLKKGDCVIIFHPIVLSIYECKLQCTNTSASFCSYLLRAVLVVYERNYKHLLIYVPLFAGVKVTGSKQINMFSFFTQFLSLKKSFSLTI